MNKSQVEQFLKQVFKVMPKDPGKMKTEIRNQLRAALSAAFAEMELVTREEFDVQSKLLSRTRQRLEEMKKRLDKLENCNEQNSNTQ